uniref:Uncharacterized protein n=1 Tax=Oryza sativa subsp. japonica TaxID=39947 RepID=Q5VPH8_ORYSJ|nr:hypothetical protein [Oryza sativa Japonica Group]BAD68647.1 hypothetical protein [Oryza sativa Japonica Group]
MPASEGGGAHRQRDGEAGEEEEEEEEKLAETRLVRQPRSTRRRRDEQARQPQAERHDGVLFRGGDEHGRGGNSRFQDPELAIADADATSSGRARLEQKGSVGGCRRRKAAVWARGLEEKETRAPGPRRVGSWSRNTVTSSGPKRNLRCTSSSPGRSLSLASSDAGSYSGWSYAECGGWRASRGSLTHTGRTLRAFYELTDSLQELHDPRRVDEVVADLGAEHEAATPQSRHL